MPPGCAAALRPSMIERQCATPSESLVPAASSRINQPECVRGILRSKNLTLFKISVLTRATYPGKSSYHIPRNFYFQLRSAGWSPTLHQLFALSEISGYCLVDWLSVFGFRLDDISRLQTTLSQPRTTLIDETIYNARAMIPWFRDRAGEVGLPSLAPFSQLLEFAGLQRLSDLASSGPSPYLYAKIGRQDAFAFPDLTPGTIVRANSRLPSRLARKSTEEISKHIFLVEHSRGFCCCRLHFGTKNRITLIANQLPFANVELQLGPEARILGVLDMELRPLTSHERSAMEQCSSPEVAADLTKLWKPVPLDDGGTREPALLLRRARLRAGLSLRQASDMSRDVARALDDNRYFTSPGSLSEYEATNNPPRHIHKLISISILYSIRFQDLLHVFGFGMDEKRKVAIPDEWMPPAGPPPVKTRVTFRPGPKPAVGFLETLLRRFSELPFFLRQSLPTLSGLEAISLRDVFWVGGHEKAIHPLLCGALLVVVDHRKRRPRIFQRKPAREQPLYLIQKRGGSYLMASCGMEEDAIVLHPFADEFVPPERLRNSVDAEVIGQIVTIVRPLLLPRN
jgi:hypothetical protein